MQKKILLLIPMLLLLAGCTTPPVRKEVQKDNLTFDSEKAEAQKQAQEAVAKQTKPISSKPMYQNPPAMTIDPEKRVPKACLFKSVQSFLAYGRTTLGAAHGTGSHVVR